MSVTHQPSFNFRRSGPARPSVRPGGDFQELEVEVHTDSVQFTHTQENGSVQLVVLWCACIVFMLFVVSVIPVMKLTTLGNALAITLGLMVLAAIGVIIQARVRSTRIQLDTNGIRIEQGNAFDRETIDIDWDDLRSVELEPVDAKTEAKGMQLEFCPVQGQPIRVLPGTGVGDLNAVRQAVLKARRGPDAPARSTPSM